MRQHKKLFGTMALFGLASLLLIGCHTDEQYLQSRSVEDTVRVRSFVVEKTVYDCDEFTLICNNISPKGIEFRLVNRLDEEVSIWMAIALDGVDAPLWSDSNESTIGAGETKDFLYHGTLEAVEHELMSVDGVAFIDSGNISFDICNLELGGAKNAKELPSGEVFYSTENLIVEYIGADAEGVNFKVVNNRKKSITFGAEKFTINGNDEDYAMGVTSIPGCSQSVYSVNLLRFNEEYFANDLSSFEGILEVFVDGEGTTDRFPVSWEM